MFKRIAPVIAQNWFFLAFFPAVLGVMVFVLTQVAVRPESAFSRGYNQKMASTVGSLGDPALREAASVVSEQLSACRLEHSAAAFPDFDSLFSINHAPAHDKGSQAYRECYIRHITAQKIIANSKQMDLLLAAAADK